LGAGYVQNNLCLLNNVATPGFNGTCSGSNNGVAVDSRGKLAFVAGPNATKSPYSISIVNLTTDRVSASVPIPENNSSIAETPIGPMYDSVNNNVYVELQGVVNQNCNMSIISVTTEKLVGKVVYGHPCSSILFDNITNEFYIIYYFGQIIVLNGTTYSTIATINTTASGLEEAALDPLTDEIYVTGGPTVAVIGAANHTVVTNIDLGGLPPLQGVGITFDDLQNRIYVAEPGNGSLGVINAQNNTLMGTFHCCGNPGSITYDPFNDFLYAETSSETETFDPLTNSAYGLLSVGGTMAIGAQNGNLLIASGGKLFQIGPPKYQLTFNETGLPSGMTWNVIVNGNTASSSNGSLQFNELNGSYNYSVPAVTGYTASPNSGNVAIPGASKMVAIGFAPIPSLQSVTITPTSTTLDTGNNTTFSALPTCSNGTCPSGVSIDWFLNNSLGNLSVTTGSVTTFTAGPTEGLVTLSVNASYKGQFATAVSLINITRPNALPTLSSVSLNPSSDTLQVQTSTSFTVVPDCQNLACPPGASYQWTENTSLGKLSSSAGQTVVFSAGSQPGSVKITVTASLNRVVKIANATVVITQVSLPALTGVVITPSSDVLYQGDRTSFLANPTCSVSPCPSGVAFTWSTNNSLGQLNSSVGAVVTFTAGTKAGEVALSLTGVLNQGTPVSSVSHIQISAYPLPLLEAVAISPGNATLTAKSPVILTAVIQCSNVSACPAGTVFEWRVGNLAMGDLNTTTGSTVTFQSTSQVGVEVVTVEAILNGVSKNASIQIHIVDAGGSTGGYLGVSGEMRYLLVGIPLLALCVCLVLLWIRRRRREDQDGEVVAPASDSQLNSR
jgi:hypothetical protein